MSPIGPGIPPDLARIVAAARACERADHLLLQTIRAAKRPAGPHTTAQVMETLALCGITWSRASLYERLQVPDPDVESTTDDDAGFEAG